MALLWFALALVIIIRILSYSGDHLGPIKSQSECKQDALNECVKMLPIQECYKMAIEHCAAILENIDDQ